MSFCLIGLGSNEGDRHSLLAGALAELGRRPGVRVLRRSQLVETAPAGGPAGQRPFLNAAALLETSLEPGTLLDALLEVENAFGRCRSVRWGPRTLDLDLLLYDDLVCATPSLTLPHPRMAWRRFVLGPAAEVAPDMRHPIIGWTVARLLEHLNTTKNYLAIAGPIASGKGELSRQLAQAPGTRWLADPAKTPQNEAFYANSPGNTWDTALKLRNRRAAMLAARASQWQDRAWLWVSDFWWDDLLAWAQVWLPAELRPAFSAQWEEAAGDMVRPKLVAVIDRPTEDLVTRVRQRGPAAAARWTSEAFDRFREAIDARLRRPDVGPVLRLVDPQPEPMLREAVAAVEAMT